MKVLLLEDDMILSEIITEYLSELSCQVKAIYNGIDAQDLVYNEKFDLLLLDVNVPGVDGLSFLKSLREVEDNTPAIFITSHDDAKSVEKGFLAGADDYLKKPFDLLELKARIDNIKRRYKIENTNIVTLEDNKSYDYKQKVLLIDAKSQQLSPKEAAILEYFIKHRSKVISFDELMNNVWSYEDTPARATLRTYIKVLRRLLGDDVIVNIKGVGYRFY